MGVSGTRTPAVRAARSAARAAAIACFQEAGAAASAWRRMRSSAAVMPLVGLAGGVSSGG
jgi:hypothetical protein